MPLSGVYVPLITPFEEDGAVDWHSLERLADRCLADGAAGLVALGTTGEPATLTDQERAGVVDCVTGVCRARGRELVVGAGGNATAQVASEVERIGLTPGITAILSVVPYYTRPSEAGIVEHFRVLARRSAVPLLIYNIPFRTGRRLGARAIIELAADERIAGVKQSIGVLDEDTIELLQHAPEGFSVLSGDDALLFSMLCLGATGGITASAHLCTSSFAALVRSVRDSNLEEARELARALAPLVAALFSEPSPAVLKGVLAARSEISSAAVRLPMTRATGAAVARAADALERAATVVVR